MYEAIIISTFFVSWSVERIYYYCFHDDTRDKALLNLNTPIETKHYSMNSSLDNPNEARYYSINTLNSPNRHNNLNRNNNSNRNNNPTNSVIDNNNNTNNSINNQTLL